ncbi:hypothetical protein [Pseudomonas sp. RIT-PI-AD]|uniref:hypothetical protein n=1 Tax=Pseudomonas sp. RIT-PI-AD TaxID=3035294 RepID=UPI0021D8A48A|nr:hypothetical protein [Pseudomonas sp. RIT-PI-AD]
MFKDFDEYNWHDNKIWGINLEQDLFESNLIIDIDHIVDWSGACEGHFLVAPAYLVFSDVTDLRVVIDWGNSGYMNAVINTSINKIKRETVKSPIKVEQYFKWEILMNDGVSSLIFGASGVRQIFRKPPVSVDRQWLSKAQRGR